MSDEPETTAARAQWLNVAPGMPTTDMQRTVRDYARMGFTPWVSADGGFAILTREGAELHFALKPDHDPRRTATWIYVRVDDADTLYRELMAAGVPMRREPRDTDYRMRETVHIDADGNMILFGSRMR